MSFQEFSLDPQLLRAIEVCGYTTPTPIQLRAIPEALAGRDLLASAQTGTGKTAAFMLPVLQRLVEVTKGPKGAPRVLVLTPTRELAAQVTQATRTYGRFLRVRCSSILGGMPYGPQFADLSQSVDLVVGTPGRLVDHLERGSLNLSRLEVLILDEADRMLDMGFKDDLDKVLAAAPAGRQTLLFSATVDRATADLAARFLREPVRIDLAGRQMTHDSISQTLHVADDVAHKRRLLRHFAADASVTRAIIFSATKRDADQLAADLNASGHRAAALHGDMNQGARNRTVRDLRSGKVRLLVATDVAARGLDVPDISHVINFDLPLAAEDYVHRIGRTGRAGASGIAISFASGGDLARLVRIERYIGRRVPRSVIAGLEATRPLEMQRPARSERSGEKRSHGDKRSFGDSRRPGAPAARGPRSAGGPQRREPEIVQRSRKPTY